MHNAESILVIITSSALTVFLIAGIVVLVLFGKLLQAIRQIVQKAERVVETAGSAAEMLRNASGPLAVFKLVRNIINSVDNIHKKEG